jgi:small-conductance mechanosensitive channel/CRP-like cAMP-binding protein
MDLWTPFQQGAASRAQAATVALAAFASALALLVLVVRPLLKLLLSGHDERSREPQLRRRLNLLLLGTLALAAWAYLYARTPPGLRYGQLRFQLSELAFLVLAGVGAGEILALFFLAYLPRLRGRAPVAPILQDLTRVVLAAAIFFFALSRTFPTADIGAILTTSAILSIVLGLALQESLSNVFAGIMLTVDRPFKPGDWIGLDGREGKVLDSNWRSTRLLTREDDVIYVPNSTLAKSNIINFSAPTPRKLLCRELQVERGAPPNRVREILVAMMKDVDGVLADPAPDVYVRDYGEASVVHQLRFWVVDYDRRNWIESEVMRGAWYHLRRAGLRLPFPVRDVRVHRVREGVEAEENLRLVRNVDLLRVLPEAQQREIAEGLGRELFARGESVCRQGDAGSTFYIVRSGTIRVTVKGETGSEVEVARLGPGAHFGEMSLLTGEPRSSTCEALVDSELLCLDRPAFEGLLQDNPGVARSLSEALAARSQANKARVAEAEDALVRVAVVEQESAAQRILDRIRTIFRFRK